MTRRILLTVFLLFTFLTSSHAGLVDVCPVGCDFSSIQAAIGAVESGDTIQLLMTTPHVEADILVTKDIVIQGIDRVQTTVQAATTANSNMGRVFTILGGNTVTFRDFSIRHGDPASGGGGGLWIQSSSNNATVTLQRTTVFLNSANNGGGIFNEGELILLDSEVSFNTATLNSGGGIDNRGRLTMTDSTMQVNTASNRGGAIFSANDNTPPQVSMEGVSLFTNQANRGGGIYNSGEFSILAGSSVMRNTAAVSGGGIHHESQVALMHIDGARVDSNLLDDGVGGGIFAAGPMTVVDTTIADNGEFGSVQPSAGGGLYISGSTVSLLMTTVEGNIAFDGGGIFNAGGALTMNQSVIWANEVDGDGGGYSQADGSSRFTNVTVAANFAESSAGGMMLCGGSFAAAHITVTRNGSGDNTAASEGGGIVFQQCGGLSTFLRSAIIAGNISDRGDFPDCQGGFSGRFSLIGDTGAGGAQSCEAQGFTSGMIYNTNPGLDALVSGTGFSRGYPLLLGSRAIDAGLCADSSGANLSVDQQGAPMPVDGDMDNDSRCDMGSLEFGSSPPRPDPIFSDGFETSISM